MNSRSAKFAAVTATTATAAALTVGMTPSAQHQLASWRDVMLTAGPDYFQLIEDLSNSYDNILVAEGNVGGAAASFWEPFASASGGLLPSFSAGTTQTNLDNVSDILTALSRALNEGTNVSVVPGISNQAAATVLEGMLAGLGVNTEVAGTLGAVIGYLGAINGTLGSLGDLVDAVNDLDVLDLTDNISLSDLLGLTATQTEFTSAYSWLGFTGLTKMGNTYVNLDSLTLSKLAANLTALVPGLLGNNNILGDLIGGLGLNLGNGSSLDDLLAALDIVSTPEVTAWIPAASGTYSALGGSLGYLAAMPTIAIGPLDSVLPDGVDADALLEQLGLDGIADTHSATVIAIPISAVGGELPLGLADFGVVNASVLFPTATGVTSLGGTTLQTLSIPLLSTQITSLNTLQAWYVGTNGVNYNSGTTATAVNVGGVEIPVVYSLGAFNIGSSGVGLTLPSLYTVGLLPSIQIGDPVGQESSDGLIGKDILNLGLTTPTQTTDVATLIGLGGVFSPAESAGTSVWNATAKPIGEQVTAQLNQVNGPITNGAASGFEQFTGAIADATGGASSASSQSPATTSSTVAAESTSSTPTGSADDLTNVSANLTDALDSASTKIQAAASSAQAKSQAAVKSAQAKLNKIAADGQKAIKNTVDGVQKAVKDAADKVNDAAKKAATK